MDKNSLTGLLLMGLVIFGFMYLNRPSAEELERQRQEREQMEAQERQKSAEPALMTLDSITPAEINSIEATVRQLGVKDTVTGVTTLAIDKSVITLSADGKLDGSVEANGQDVPVAAIVSNDLSSLKGSVADAAVKNLREGLATAARYKGLTRHLSGDSTTVKLENKYLSLELSNKGGVISRATLLDYDSYDSTKVTLLDPATDSYGFTLTSATQRFDTREFYFTPIIENDSTVFMGLDMGDGAKWGIRYTLPEDSYLVNIDVVQSGMEVIIPSSVASMDLNWHQKMRRYESGRVFEERNSALYYMYVDGDVDNLSESSDKSEEINQRLKWVACKNQFFSAVLMARTNFSSANLESKVLDSPDFIKAMNLDMTMEYSAALANPASFVMYLGPNSYPLMSEVEKNIFPEENMNLNKLIPLGWPIFRWINTLIIIPLFTFLGSFISNYGIIILILTIFIKLILFPFTYKSYMSQARMRLLAPEIKAINDKYPGNENAMKRQQETMALYSRAGANPMSGCLPLLLQMPVLVAMFWFFPSAIELRGESFLWAKDLAAPDAIISWNANIPFISSTFGNHVSLFCLLMTVTNIIYTRINMQNQPSSSAMPGMKWMMYLMPVMFLFIFNNYASGLSYYYFLSLLITIVQTYAVRKFVSEDKMRAKMAENAKKPKKKSGFMARLEEAQRRQQAMLREQQKQKGKKR
ncbi:MAG: membrane protein insertase YidC [Duncaniella sp.]|nr:membrane protein insertase YidC [Duncaniella sp.]